MTHRLDAQVAQSEPPAAVGDRVVVAAVGLVEADAAELARLRAAIQPPAAEGRILKHSTEQTVLAVAAVVRAAEAGSLGSFDDWGVIVAPRWLGRAGTAAVVERFHAVGVRGVGPHAIPNLSMHAAAATVSLCLGAHGPVFGAGGGPGHVADGLLAGLAAQLGRDSPGTWLALTEWDGDETAGEGRAIALALAPADIRQHQGHPTLMLSYHLGRASSELDVPRLAGLMKFLGRTIAARWDCPIEGGAELSLTAESES
jgi:hypothetical protein